VGHRANFIDAKRNGEHLPIFIVLNNKMKELLDIKRFKFYLWVGLAFLLLGLFSNVADHKEEILKRVLNNTWAVSYLTVLNYFLFEYTFPSLSRKKILKSLLLY